MATTVKNEILPAKVSKTSGDNNGREIGEYNSNPVLNSSLYYVECDGMTIMQYTSNIIAQNLFENIDDEGYSLTRMDAIIDYTRVTWYQQPTKIR